jgi:acetate kinase
MADSEDARLAYNVFLDRLLGYISQYLCKLLATTEDVGIVFSGGIGEKSQKVRADVLEHFAWMGVKVKASVGDGVVEEISDGKLRGWVVKTDEEGWCARLARDDFDI